MGADFAAFGRVRFNSGRFFQRFDEALKRFCRLEARAEIVVALGDPGIGVLEQR